MHIYMQLGDGAAGGDVNYITVAVRHRFLGGSAWSASKVCRVLRAARAGLECRHAGTASSKSAECSILGNHSGLRRTRIS
eukprot:6458954-Amphidinium_carterae.2